MCRWSSVSWCLVLLERTVVGEPHADDSLFEEREVRHRQPRRFAGAKTRAVREIGHEADRLLEIRDQLPHDRVIVEPPAIRLHALRRTTAHRDLTNRIDRCLLARDRPGEEPRQQIHVVPDRRVAQLLRRALRIDPLHHGRQIHIREPTLPEVRQHMPPPDPRCRHARARCGLRSPERTAWPAPSSAPATACRPTSRVPGSRRTSSACPVEHRPHASAYYRFTTRLRRARKHKHPGWCNHPGCLR